MRSRTVRRLARSTALPARRLAQRKEGVQVRDGAGTDVLRRGIMHFHMLFLDGVYVERADGSMRFRWVKAPTSVELTQLSHRIARRSTRYTLLGLTATMSS